MSTKLLSSWLAAMTTAGALLTMVFASGCKTNPQSIPHPPNQPQTDPKDSKDGPVHHPRRHRAEPPPVRTSEPAPITHPGG